MTLVFRKSRWAYAHWYLLIGILLLGGSIVWQSTELVISALLLFPALILAIACEIARIYEKATLTDREVHYERGIFARHQSKAQYRSITNISVQQGFFQRVLGYGDVLIDTPGGTGYEITLHSFAQAPKIELLIQQRMNSQQSRKN